MLEQTTITLLASSIALPISVLTAYLAIKSGRINKAQLDRTVKRDELSEQQRQWQIVTQNYESRIQLIEDQHESCKESLSAALNKIAILSISIEQLQSLNMSLQSQVQRLTDRQGRQESD